MARRSGSTATPATPPPPPEDDPQDWLALQSLPAPQPCTQRAHNAQRPRGWIPARTRCTRHAASAACMHAAAAHTQRQAVGQRGGDRGWPPRPAVAAGERQADDRCGGGGRHAPPRPLARRAARGHVRPRRRAWPRRLGRVERARAARAATACAAPASVLCRAHVTRCGLNRRRRWDGQRLPLGGWPLAGYCHQGQQRQDSSPTTSHSACVWLRVARGCNFPR